MPIANIQDAREVEQSLHNILAESDTQARIRAIRSLFIETLDYYHADSKISLHNAGNNQLPQEAHLIARRDGVSVVYVSLDSADSNRVTGAAASAAARALGNVLADNLLLLFTNRDNDQLHFINPDLSGSRPKLQRIVAYRDLPQRTTVQQIANMWNSYDKLGKTVREAIAIAFSVEPVTDGFFRAYDALFKNAKDQIGGFGDSETEREQKHVFTQTLFNRLMFVYFLSRKGWLKFNDNTDYLNTLWGDYGSLEGDHDFYTARLRPLFFSGLNNPQSRDLVRDNPVLYRTIGQVPFLNGGLFEETDLDKREGITVPDDVIKQILNGLFDRFNFTVMESTPYDVEVAVDPEMLGKVFEELVTGRHDSGAYYTPRPVVSFMCREALKGYLEGKETGASTEAIAAFVDLHDTDGIGVAEARRISLALRGVTVVDPACGSGAYLLGMMQELIELQNTLFNVGVDARSLYELKLEIIQRNLYGVDIDDFAVNIAMLRLWLSLAIDYEGDDPQPLPNLDFKVLCGDSLLGPDPSAGVEVQGTLGQDVEQFHKLGELKARYMRASLGSDKDRLRSEIRESEVAIRESLGAGGAVEGVIDWRVEFVEVFAERRGFDVAIANPPYIQLQSNGGRLADFYRDAGYRSFVRSGDIYQLFYERGCQVLSPGRGLLTYITSNSWLRAQYGKATRRFFSECHTPLLLLELGKDVFESAIVDSGILVLRTGGQSGPFPAVDLDRLAVKKFPPTGNLWGLAKPDGESPWSVLSLAEYRAIDKMQNLGTALKDWDVSINYGIKTGFNDAFIIDTTTKEALVAKDPKSAELIKPMLRGRDIRQYRANWAGLWLIYSHTGVGEEDYPAIRDHLTPHRERLSQRRGGANPKTKQVPYEWWQLQVDYYNSGTYLNFLKEKLIWIELVESGRFAYDDTGVFGEATTFIMTGESLKYLCGLLNSALVRWFLQQTAPTSGMGTFRWKKVYVETIPIPKISEEEQQPLVALVEEILHAKDTDADVDTADLEREIDRLVYELYGLTEEEITAVERSLGLINATDEEEDLALARLMEEQPPYGPEDFVGEEEVRATLRAVDAS